MKKSDKIYLMLLRNKRQRKTPSTQKELAEIMGVAKSILNRALVFDIQEDILDKALSVLSENGDKNKSD